jgi:hypothetical protein
VKRATRHTTRLGVALLLSALVLAPPAAPAPSKIIGHGVRLKGSSVWYVQGTAREPKTISGRVVASPVQLVKVQWAVVCQRPNVHDPARHLATKVKSGEVSLRQAGTVMLALPYPKPHTCVATIYATLEAKGSVTLRLLQT